jgi:S-ribosylhomocysteine lyase LuxS involved in autoinducer biosynthesis
MATVKAATPVVHQMWDNIKPASAISACGSFAQVELRRAQAIVARAVVEQAEVAVEHQHLPHQPHLGARRFRRHSASTPVVAHK